MCEKAASETPSLSPIIFTWYQSLVRGKELKKANQVRGVLVRGPVLLFVFEFGSKSLQVAQPESARVHCLRLRHPSRCDKRALYATGPVLEAEVLSTHSKKGPSLKFSDLRPFRGPF